MNPLLRLWYFVYAVLAGYCAFDTWDSGKVKISPTFMGILFALWAFNSLIKAITPDDLA